MGRPLDKKNFMTGSSAVSGTTLLIHSAIGSGVYNSAIVKQTGSKRFKTVRPETSETGVAYLVPTNTLEPGQAYMTATDRSGATYFVSKITDRMVTIVRHSGAEDGNVSSSPPATGWLFLTNSKVPWTTSSIVPEGYVKLEVY